MKGFMMTGLALVWLAAGQIATRVAIAQDDRSNDRPATAPGRQFQELEDPVEPLVPRDPRGKSDEARVDALALFARGRILQDRGNLQGALAAYQQAIERDPTALPVYRVLIPLAIDLNRIDDAVKWATKATELDPADEQFLSQAAGLLIKHREDIAGAIRVLDRASRVPSLDKLSPQYVNIMLNLAVLNQAADRKADAVAAFEVVFDALINPEKYHLDFKTRAQMQKNPALAFDKLGQIFLDGKKTELALLAFQRAAELKKGPGAANLNFNLAQVYLQSGEPEKALIELQKYIDTQLQSKERAPYDLLAEILAKLGRSKDLIPRLEAAAEKDARNSWLQFYLAEQYAEANQLDAAEALFKKTLASSSEVPGYVGLAGVYRRKNQPAELLATLSKGYSEAGDLKPFVAEFKAIIANEKLFASLMKSGEALLGENPVKLDFPTGYVLANLAADGKQSDLAEKYYRSLLSLRKERADLIYQELGAHYIELKKYEDAARIYKQAAEDGDLAEIETRANFLFMATQALELAGDTKGALAAIAAAHELMPNNPVLRFQEGWVYYHAHRFDEAIARMEKLIEDFPQRQARTIVRKAQYSLSNMHVLKGDIRKGEEILEAIYQEDPDDVSVNNDLGYLYADQGKNLERAEGMIRKAVSSDPENGAYLDSLGWVLFKREKFDEALPYLEKAVKNSQGAGDETLWEHLADLQDRLKQPAKALETLRKSLELAEKATHPDPKLIERVKEKIAAHEK